MASILLQLPFYKHVFGWIGGHAAGADPTCSASGLTSVLRSMHVLKSPMQCRKSRRI